MPFAPLYSRHTRALSGSISPAENSVRHIWQPRVHRRVHRCFRASASTSSNSAAQKFPPKMQNIIDTIKTGVFLIVSFPIAFVALGTPLRRFFLPLLGRPTGIRGMLLAKLVLPVINTKMQDAVLRAAAASPSDRVLELGFANGDLLERLLDQGVKPPVYGLDIIDDMVTLAGNRLGRKAILGNRDVQDDSLGRGELTYGALFDTQKCELAGVNPRHQVAPFDIILFVNVFYFFSDDGIDIAARNLWRLLQTGGRVLTPVNAKEADSEAIRRSGFEGNLSSERYINAMRKAGFEVDKETPSGTKFVVIVATKPK